MLVLLKASIMAAGRWPELFAALHANRSRTLSLLDPETILDRADTWRRFAHEWTERAKDCRDPERAADIRRRAQLALYAAYEADLLLQMREQCGAEPDAPEARRTDFR